MVRIAVCQMEILPNDANANFEKIIEFTNKAKQKNADIIVFPEKCDGIINESIYKESVNDFISKFRNLCSEYKIHGVLGSLLVKKNNQYFNRTHFVNDMGQIIGKYDKQKIIPDVETDYTTPGEENVIVNTKFGKIGLAICLDITNPEIFTQYKKMGADIVICPMMWELNVSWDAKLKDQGIDLLSAAYGVVRKISEARAIENHLFIVICNAAGKFLHKDFWFTLYGHSSVCEPMYGCMTSLDHDRESMLIADIDKNKIKIAHNYFSL